MGNRKRGAMKMKLSTIAKTSLALGILTTGVMTTHAQSADAAWENSGVQFTKDTKALENLRDYYNKKELDLRNVNGYLNGNGVTVLHHNQHTDVKLLGSDKSKYSDEDLKNIDVFVLGEGLSKQAPTQSIGGITKPNSKDYRDYVKQVPVTIERKTGEFTSQQGIDPLQIKKENISLKELDFKLRKQLIKSHGLYSNNINKGKIVVKMKDRKIANDYYTFDLSKKLEEERMGDVIDTKYIDRIDVEYK